MSYEVKNKRVYPQGTLASHILGYVNLDAKLAAGVEKTGGEFKGGVVLIGNECDKNLTFEALIQSVKDEKQAEIASRLFG